MNSYTESIDYRYLEYPIVRSLNYGNSSKVDLVILCQHGFNSKEFIENFPHLISCFKGYSQNTISKYLDIEHDFAARRLAINLAKTLSTKINVLFVGINCDRGIMDANRLPKYCVSSFVNNNASDEIILELQAINIFIRNTIFSILKKHLDPSGYIIDVHSMWPFNMNIPESKLYDIEEFSESFTNFSYLGNPRNINLIVHQNDGQSIADKKLAYFIEQELIINNYSVEYDNPFCILPIRSNYQYFKHYRGIAFDIPRTLLGKRSSENPIDFSFMIESQEMITNISNAIASGLLKLFAFPSK